MGEYAPDDQRTVHNNTDGEWQDKQAENASRKNQSPTNDGEGQMGYGNARNENGTSEQAEAEGDLENSLNSDVYDAAQPGETSDNEAERARADANRPLNGS